MYQRALYLIHNPETPYYKIGIAYRPEARLRQLRRDYEDNSLYFINVWYPADARSAEQKLHKDLAQWRGRSARKVGGYTEWFELDGQAARLLCILVTRAVTRQRRRFGRYDYLEQMQHARGCSS
jgi:hypothetical protein